MQKLAWILVIVGALNWGLIGVGFFLNMNLNLVNLLFGAWPMVEYIVYLVVGVAAVLRLPSWKTL